MTPSEAMKVLSQVSAELAYVQDQLAPLRMRRKAVYDDIAAHCFQTNDVEKVLVSWRPMGAENIARLDKVNAETAPGLKELVPLERSLKESRRECEIDLKMARKAAKEGKKFTPKYKPSTGGFNGGTTGETISPPFTGPLKSLGTGNQPPSHSPLTGSGLGFPSLSSGSGGADEVSQDNPKTLPENRKDGPMAGQPRRQKKSDRLSHPDAGKAEIARDQTLAPFDRMSAVMDRKWGVGRLAELVSPNTALIWGNTLARVNEAIKATYLEEDQKATAAEMVAAVESALRGFKVMDDEATATGAKPADPTVWEYDLDGYKIGVMLDADAWPRIRAERPDLRLVSMREVAVAMRAVDQNPSLALIREDFPDAKITDIRPKPTDQPTKPPVDWAGGGDDVPF